MPLRELPFDVKRSDVMTTNRLRILEVQGASAALDEVESWCDEPEMQRWMGAGFRFELFRAEMGTSGRLPDGRGGYRERLNTAGWIGLDDVGRQVAFIGGQVLAEPVDIAGSGLGLAPSLTLGFFYVVSPDHRRRGYGRALVEEALKHPSTSAIDVFSCTVSIENTASLRVIGGIEGFESTAGEETVSFTYIRPE